MTHDASAPRTPTTDPALAVILRWVDERLAWERFLLTAAEPGRFRDGQAA